jgi:chromosome segregation ATPase
MKLNELPSIPEPPRLSEKPAKRLFRTITSQRQVAPPRPYSSSEIKAIKEQLNSCLEGIKGLKTELASIKSRKNEKPALPELSELAHIKRELEEHLNTVSKTEVPENIANVDKKLDDFQEELIRLAKIESSTQTNMNRSVAETKKGIEGLKEQLFELNSNMGSQKAQMENSLKRLEERFGEELTKLIEWINYFNSKIN